MKNFTVQSEEKTYTIMADNYKVENGQFIFEASGVEIKRFDKKDIKNVLLESQTGGGENLDLIKS